MVIIIYENSMEILERSSYHFCFIPIVYSVSVLSRNEMELENGVGFANRCSGMLFLCRSSEWITIYNTNNSSKYKKLNHKTYVLLLLML